LDLMGAFVLRDWQRLAGCTQRLAEELFSLRKSRGVVRGGKTSSQSGLLMG